jgi:hypothetical protein
MTEFIFVYLFFGSCMFVASYAESSYLIRENWGSNLWRLLVSLFWPWFIVTGLFRKVIR